MMKFQTIRTATITGIERFMKLLWRGDRRPLYGNNVGISLRGVSVDEIRELKKNGPVYLKIDKKS